MRAPEIGWDASQTWLVLGTSVVLLAVFVAIQASRRTPLVRLSIFRAPNLGAANVAQFLLGAVGGADVVLLEDRAAAPEGVQA